MPNVDDSFQMVLCFSAFSEFFKVFSTCACAEYWEISKVCNLPDYLAIRWIWTISPGSPHPNCTRLFRRGEGTWSRSISLRLSYINILWLNDFTYFVFSKIMLLAKLTFCHVFMFSVVLALHLFVNLRRGKDLLKS